MQHALLHMPFNINYSSSLMGMAANGTLLPYSPQETNIHYDWNSENYLGFMYAFGYEAALHNYEGSSTPGMIVQTFPWLAVINANFIAIGWMPDPVAIGYDVRFNDILYTDVLFSRTPISFIYGQALTWNVSTVSPGRIYPFQVRGRRGANVGVWSVLNFVSTLSSSSSSSSSS